MNETRTSFISACIILVIMTLIAVPFLSPWQLFRSLCPYFSPQSPQCAMLQQQLQQQQPYATQQQPPVSSSAIGGAPSTSTSTFSPGLPSSSTTTTAPSP
jgi:hypothetical protein